MKSFTSYFFFALIVLSGICHGCTDEKLIDEGPAGNGKAAVEFTLLSPSSAVFRSGQNFTAPAYENQITDILLCVFRNGKLAEIAKPKTSDIVVTGITAKFSLYLKATSQPVKFYVLANSGLAPNETELNALRFALREKTPEEVKAELKDLAPGFGKQGVEAPFPMWGEYDRPNGLPEALPNVHTQIADLKLIRGVARAIITKEVDDNVFRIHSVAVYNMNKHIRLIPEEVENNRVKSPTLPHDVSYLSVSGIEVPQNNDAVSFYLPENIGFSPAQAKTDATYIVVGGYYKGSNQLSYHRVDFKTDPQKTGEIKRNHSYTFNIQSVTGPGNPDPDTPGEATLILTVEEWENESAEAFQNNEHYFTMTSQVINVPGSQGSSHYIDISTDVKNFTMQWNDATDQPDSLRIENNLFIVVREEMKPAEYPDLIPTTDTDKPDFPLNNKDTYFFRLHVTAKTANISSESVTSAFTIKAANLTVPMTIRQIAPSYLKPATTFTWVASDGSHPVTIPVQSSHPWRVVKIVKHEGSVGLPWEESNVNIDISQPITDWVVCQKNDTELVVSGLPNRDDTVHVELQHESYIYGAALPRNAAIVLENDAGSTAVILVHQEVWRYWSRSNMIGSHPNIRYDDEGNVLESNFSFDFSWIPLWRINGVEDTFLEGETKDTYYQPSNKLYGPFDTTKQNYFRPGEIVGDHRYLESWKTDNPDQPANYGQQGDYYHYDGARAACAYYTQMRKYSFPHGLENPGPILSEESMPSFYKDIEGSWSYLRSSWMIPTEGDAYDLMLRAQVSANNCYYVTNSDGSKSYFPSTGNDYRANFFPTEVDWIRFFVLDKEDADNISSNNGNWFEIYRFRNPAPPGRLHMQHKHMANFRAIPLWNNNAMIVRCIRRIDIGYPE